MTQIRLDFANSSEGCFHSRKTSFVREHLNVPELEHTYSFIHARNSLGTELGGQNLSC